MAEGARSILPVTRAAGAAGAAGVAGAAVGPAPAATNFPLIPDALAGTGSWRRQRDIVVSTFGPGVAAAAVYAASAVFIYHRILFAATGSMPGCDCGDQAQEVWFLRWPLYAIGHGLNPFYSTWMNYPKGVNLAINTSSPLLGILSAPLQLTIGTVSTYDVLLVLALTSSALSMCLALRRWVRTWAAAFTGGLLYGFSPYMIGQGGGHVFLVVLFIPPIVLTLLHEIVVSQRNAAVRNGLLLGLLLVLQYYISPEILAMTLIVAVTGVALLAVVRWRTVWDRLPHVVVAALVTAAVCAAALVYPLWMSTHGPQHVVGPPHPLSGLAIFPGDLLGPVVPTSNQLGLHALAVRGDVLVGNNAGENGMYLGVPLLIVLAVFVSVYRRRRALCFFGAMVVVSTILALGPTLVVDTHHTGIPLPAWILGRLPLLQDILDVRFSLFAQLAAAAALAIGLDEMITAARGRYWQHGSFPLAAVVGPAAAAIVALAPLIPSAPYPAAATMTPAFFSSPAVDRIPAGSAVLTYPFPLRADAEWSMTFQAEADMRFKVFGGDAFVPDGPGGTSVPVPAPLTPSVVEHLFSDAYTPTFAKFELGTAPDAPTPRVDQATVMALRTFLARYHVSTVVVGDFGLSPHAVVGYVSDALGHPVKTGGVWAWFDVPRLLAHAPAVP